MLTVVGCTLGGALLGAAAGIAYGLSEPRGTDLPGLGLIATIPTGGLVGAVVGSAVGALVIR